MVQAALNVNPGKLSGLRPTAASLRFLQNNQEKNKLNLLTVLLRSAMNHYYSAAPWSGRSFSNPLCSEFDLPILLKQQH